MKRWVSLIAMLALLIVAMVRTGTTNYNAITVSGGVTSESQILGNIMVQMIEHYTDENVEFMNNLGTATIEQQAMRRGDLDVSATRYTGTDMVTTLGLTPIANAGKANAYVQQQFNRRWGFYWSDGYGFANQFTFMVTKATATRYHLKTVSDLAKVADKLTLGTDQAWLKRKGDGYAAWSKAYGAKFGRVMPMQVGLLYDALANRQLDVILGYSTDGRIGSYHLVMLKDDRQFFPAYTASFVLSQTIQRRYPKLRSILDRVNGSITTADMQRMNYQADDGMLEPSVVAKQFLIKHDYFEREVP